jgi:hypothetical protein
MNRAETPSEDVIAELARIHAGLTRTIARLRDVNAKFAASNDAAQDEESSEAAAA